MGFMVNQKLLNHLSNFQPNILLVLEIRCVSAINKQFKVVLRKYNIFIEELCTLHCIKYQKNIYLDLVRHNHVNIIDYKKKHW